MGTLNPVDKNKLRMYIMKRLYNLQQSFERIPEMSKRELRYLCQEFHISLPEELKPTFTDYRS